MSKPGTIDEAVAADGAISDIKLIELSIVLLAESNNPSIVNPDFLLRNGIIDETWKLKAPAVATPVLAELIYEGGLSVRADPERIAFVQELDGTSLADCVCPTMAEVYVGAVPHVPYKAVGINPRFFVESGDAGAAPVSSLLDGQGSWLTSNDSAPVVRITATFPLAAGRLAMEVGGAEILSPDGKPAYGVSFRANAHRELGQSDQSSRIGALTSIVRSWEGDVKESREIVCKFVPRLFTGLQ